MGGECKENWLGKAALIGTETFSLLTCFPFLSLIPSSLSASSAPVFDFYWWLFSQLFNQLASQTIFIEAYYALNNSYILLQWENRVHQFLITKADKLVIGLNLIWPVVSVCCRLLPWCWNFPLTFLGLLVFFLNSPPYPSVLTFLFHPFHRLLFSSCLLNTGSS